MLGVVVGYFLGKFSYQSKCAEKIMHLPNSPLGEMLRRNKYGGSKEILSIDPSFGVSLAPFGNIETYSDIGPQHDIDVDRPYQQGLDDSGRPSLDSSMLEDDDLSASAQNHSTTYDELRRKNREEYEQKKPKPYRGEEGQPIFRPRPTPPPADAGPPSPFPQPHERLNKYGDVWEK
ncbi:OCIA domain-containing protein 1 isoform X2 [Bacillus rossius redtenbacheri]